MRTNVRLQSMVVLGSQPPAPVAGVLITHVPDASGKYVNVGNGGSYITVESNSTSVAITTRAENRVLKNFSSIPVVLQPELVDRYEELGHALSEMTEFDEEDQLKIDEPVYKVACYVAAELMSHSFPPPRLFNHGPKSVVFNWTTNSTSLYLTVSANAVSALVSTPERIKRRIEFPAGKLINANTLFPALSSAQLDRPVINKVNAVSQRVEFAE